jgi:hypothetical protein
MGVKPATPCSGAENGSLARFRAKPNACCPALCTKADGVFVCCWVVVIPKHMFALPIARLPLDL